MSEEVRDDSTVSFTVKELLAEQTDLLRGIDHKVDGKADKADLIPLVAKLDNHDQRILSIEDSRKADKILNDARTSTRRRWWAVTTAVVVPLATACIIVFVH